MEVDVVDISNAIVEDVVFPHLSLMHDTGWQHSSDCIRLSGNSIRQFGGQNGKTSCRESSLF